MREERALSSSSELQADGDIYNYRALSRVPNISLLVLALSSQTSSLAVQQDKSVHNVAGFLCDPGYLDANQGPKHPLLWLITWRQTLGMSPRQQMCLPLF